MKIQVSGRTVHSIQKTSTHIHRIAKSPSLLLQCNRSHAISARKEKVTRCSETVRIALPALGRTSWGDQKDSELKTFVIRIN